VKTFSVSVILTAAVWYGASAPAHAQTTQDQTYSSANTTNTSDPFLAKAMESNAAEIELGRMAESKSTDPRVKALAEMMVRDHTNALNRLNQMTAGNSNPMPNGGTDSSTAMTSRIPLSREHQEMRDRLSQLSGDDFDRAYVDAMVREHQTDVREFEREAKTASSTDTSTNIVTDQNTAIREKPEPGAPPLNQTDAVIARDMLPTLRMHLQHAEMLQQRFGSSGTPGNNLGGDGDGTKRNERTQ